MRFFHVLFLSLSLSYVAKAADQKIASVEVNVEAAAEKTAGIRTLFIIVYAQDGKMPYGAMKVDLKADAKGTVYKGDLTTANVQTMGGGPVPQSLRLKARLDKDGSAGPDQPGDLAAIVESVKAGGSAKIVIK